ncbi:MAG: hypothetical protein ACHP78_05195 [Terriglobales bacterium]
MKRRLSLVLAAVLAFGLVSLAVAQQQDQSNNKTAPNPLVQLLQNKGVLTAQEATAINQAATPAEQQSRLTQLLYSKGLITPDEYKTTAAAEASKASESQGTWIQTAAHVSAGEPQPAMAMPPQAPAAPAVIPAVAPVRVLTNDPPKAGGMVPDLKLGSGAKVKLYGFVKATAAYDSSNPYNIDFELPGLGGIVGGALPTSVPTGLTSPFGGGIAGVGSADSGPNGSPSFYLKGSATRMGANFEWPDLAGANNTLTGRIEADFEGNFSRAQNRNVSSVRTRMLALRLAWARIDHKFSEDTTGFILFGMDWTPFGSSTQANLLETTGGMAYFGGMYEREAQIRLGLWHDFGGPRNFKIGIEPALGMPGFGNNSTDVGTQLGVSERDGADSGRPEISGRMVFQWQLDKARGVAPAQLIFSGMNAKRVEIVNRAAIAASDCAASGVAGTGCVAGAVTSLLAAFPHGAEPSSQRWGADVELQLPTRYATLVGKYYTGADLKWYFAGQVFGVFNDNRIGLQNAPGTIGEGVVMCNINPTNCPNAFNIDASAPNAAFGWNPATSQWQIVPQRPVRTVGGFAQISFPLSRIFDANPAGRNAGWTIAFTVSDDQAKARDVRAAAGPIGAINGSGTTGGLLANGYVANSNGSRDRSDAAAMTLVWKFNQFVSFNLESSLYLTRSTCIGGNGTSTGVITASFDSASCAGTVFRADPARYWHDFRNEFGPVFTF